MVLVGKLYLDRVPLAASPCLQSLYLAEPSSCWLSIHIYCVDRSAASLSADMCVVWSSKAIKSHFSLTFLVDIWLKLLLRLSKGICRQNGYLYTYIQIRHPDLWKTVFELFRSLARVEITPLKDVSVNQPQIAVRRITYNQDLVWIVKMITVQWPLRSVKS